MLFNAFMILPREFQRQGICQELLFASGVIGSICIFYEVTQNRRTCCTLHVFVHKASFRFLFLDYFRPIKNLEPSRSGKLSSLTVSISNLVVELLPLPPYLWKLCKIR